MKTITSIETFCQTYGLEKGLVNIISDNTRLKTVISDIKTEQNIHIEITRFVNRIDFFRELEEQLRIKREELARLDEHERRSQVSSQIQQLEEEVRDYKIGILTTASTLYDIKETKNLRAVKQQFFRGQLKKAIQLINAKDLAEAQQQLIQILSNQSELDQVYDRLEDNANEYRVKASLTGINLEIIQEEDRYQKAIEFFEKGRISVDRTQRTGAITKYLYSYAGFVHEKNRTLAALPIYEEALSLQRQWIIDNPTSSNWNVLVGLLHDLGNLCLLMEDTRRGEELQLEALSFLDQLQEFDAKTFLPQYLVALCNLGANKHHQGDLPTAGKFYSQVIITLNRIDDIEGKVELWVMIYEKLGLLQLSRKEFNKAILCFTKSLSSRYRLAKENPEDQAPYIVETLNRLGVLFREKHEFQQAIQFHQRALETLEPLLDINPYLIIPALAATLNNLGTDFLSNQELEKALDTFQRALETNKRMRIVNPGGFHRMQAEILTNFGLAQKNSRLPAKAEQSFLDAMKNLQHLSNQDQDNEGVKILSAKTLLNISQLRLEQQNLPGALEAADQAQTIYAKVFEADQSTYADDYISVLLQQGNIKRELEAFPEAESFYNQAIKVITDQIEQHPAIYEPSLVKILNSLALVQASQDRLEEARNSYLKCLNISRKLFQQNERAFASDFLIFLYNFANFQMDQGQMLEAEVTLKEALPISKLLVEQNSVIYLEDLANVINDLAFVRSHEKDLDAAHELMLKALSLYRRLAEKATEKHLGALGRTLSGIGVLEFQRGNFKTSRGYLEEAIPLLRKLSEANPEEFEGLLSWALRDLAGLLYTQYEEYELAKGYYQEASKLLFKFAMQDPKVYAPPLEGVLENIAYVSHNGARLINPIVALQERVEIYKVLILVDLNTYFPKYLMAVENLATMQRVTGMLEEAAETSAELVLLLTKIAPHNPGTYEPLLAGAKKQHDQIKAMLASPPSHFATPWNE